MMKAPNEKRKCENPSILGLDPGGNGSTDCRPRGRAWQIAAALKPFVERHELAGAVTLVADKEKVLSREAIGLADLATGKPMRTDAIFWIASQSKPVTATPS
jgi:CubicO group peptidase (beta-lactamase class C family)